MSPLFQADCGFGIRVYLHAKTRIEKRWNRMPLHNEFWRLYCNSQTGAALASATSHLALRPGRLILVPPRFAGWGLVRGSVDHAYAHFDVTGLPHGLAPLLFPLPVEVPQSREIEVLIGGWLRELQGSRPGDPLPGLLRVESLAALALAGCWSAGRISQSAGWKAWQERSPRMAQLEAWMQSRLAEDLSVSCLALWAGYSPDHFRRLFLRVFGLNPAVYVRQLRIKEAARLLLFGQESIEKIAEKTGFVDRHHFTRVFRARTGETPAAYRKTALRYAAEAAPRKEQ